MKCDWLTSIAPTKSGLFSLIGNGYCEELNYMKRLIKYTLLYGIGFISTVHGQINQTNIRDILNNPSFATRFNSPTRVKGFYAVRQFRAMWSNEMDKHQLLVHINAADQLGLSKNDYQP